ncbi:Uncharacterised protein [Pseudomonas aeruginosa]|nr:Uncharacterised protein [Pseudomonas aeruginosa]
MPAGVDRGVAEGGRQPVGRRPPLPLSSPTHRSPPGCARPRRASPACARGGTRPRCGSSHPGTAARVEGVDVEMEQAIARQHPHQAAVLQAVDRRVHRQRADTHAGDHRLGHGVSGVDLEMRLVDAGQFLAVGTVEQPAVQRHHRVHQAQATVRGQLRRQPGEAMRGNVARRGAEDAVGLADALGDETGVRQLGAITTEMS